MGQGFKEGFFGNFQLSRLEGRCTPGFQVISAPMAPGVMAEIVFGFLHGLGEQFNAAVTAPPCKQSNIPCVSQSRISSSLLDRFV